MKRPPNRILLPLALGVAALLLWDTVVAYPFRVFVVLLHEISHGLAAVLTPCCTGWPSLRGRIVVLAWRQGGPAMQQGESRS